MRKLLPIFILLPAFLVSCDRYDIGGMFKSSGPSSDSRFAQSAEYLAAHPFDDITATSDAYTVNFLTDIHAESDAPHLQEAVAGILCDATAEHFAVCLGDLTSGRGHLPVVHEAFEAFTVASWPLVITPGNHELYFGGWAEYSLYWPASSFSFRVVTPSAGYDLFICVDSANAALGRLQRSWLESTLAGVQSIPPRHIIVLTHTHFFQSSNTLAMIGNFNTEEAYDLMALFADYGVDAVFSGHCHYESHTLFRGVDYYSLSPFMEEEASGSRYRIHFGESISLEEIRR